MTKRIEVPGVGIVEFPESMSDEQITNAIRTNIMPQYSVQAETPLQTFGRSTASLADTALNAVTGTMDVGAKALARAYYGGLRGKPLAEAERLAQQEGTSPKDVVGRMFGVTGTPGYEGAPLRQLGTYAGQTIGENVIQPLAQTTGLPESYVGDVVGLGATAVAPGVGRAAQVATQPVRNVATGFREGLRNPQYVRNQQTAFAPLQDTYYPSKQVDPFMKATPEQRVGMLPELEASQKPSSSMFATPSQMLARNLGPKGPNKETLIPYRGETMRAFGEQLGRDISGSPLISGTAGLGGALVGGLIGGIPGALIGGAIAPTARLGQMASLQRLGKTAGFSRGFPEALSEAQGTVGTQMLAGSGAPRLGYTPNPIIPTGYSQPRQVNIEGQSYKLPYQIDTSQVQTARAPQQATPTVDLAQLAAQRSAQEAAKSAQPVRQAAAQQVSGPVDPNNILAQIRARGKMPPPPAPEGGTPVTTNPPPTTPPAGGGSLFDPANFNKLSDKDKLAALRQRAEQNPPPAMTSKQETQMRKEIAGSQADTNKTIISDFANTGLSDKIDMISQTIPIDLGKDAFNASNATRGMANHLVKNGIDSIPVLPGMTEAQTVHAIFKEMTGKGGAKKKATDNLSQPSTTTRTSQTIRDEINKIDEQMTALRENNLGLSEGGGYADKVRLNPDSPAGQEYMKQMSDLSKQSSILEKEFELAKKAEKKAGKKAPSNVSQMLTGDLESLFAKNIFDELKTTTEYPRPSGSPFTPTTKTWNKGPFELTVEDFGHRKIYTIKDTKTGIEFNKINDLQNPTYVEMYDPKTERYFAHNKKTYDGDETVSVYNVNTEKDLADWKNGKIEVIHNKKQYNKDSPQPDIFKELENYLSKNLTTKDLGTEIKVPEKKPFDPNNPQQSFDELVGMTNTEKRYRDMSPEQLLKTEKDLNEVLNNPNAYASDVKLAKQGLEYIRKYKK